MIEVLEKVWDSSPAVSSLIAAPASPSVPAGPKNDAELAVTRAGMPGKVLVTGATGYLGHRLVAALSRCGADVVALVREENRVSQDLERQATIVRGDIRDPASIEAAMQDVAVVYHCAAITRNAVPWTAHQETNILGTKVVLEEALKAHVQRVIHVSSVIVYGLKRPRNNQPVQESAPYAQNANRWAYYMRSKIEADKLALSYWQEQGLPVTVVRPGILYGPGGKTIGGGASHLGPVRLFIGSGRNRLPYVYVDNAIELLLLAAISPEAVGQVYNAVDEPQVRVRDVAARRREMTGEQSSLVPVPPFLFSSLARLLELRASLSDSETPPKLSRFVVRSACRDMVYDTTNAREQVGWQPEVSLEEGLHRALNDIS
jgi:nucleoside-diphosphate-sugar epimerase